MKFKFDFLSWFLALLIPLLLWMLKADSKADGFSWITEGKPLMWAAIAAFVGLLANLAYDNWALIRGSIKAEGKDV